MTHDITAQVWPVHTGLKSVYLTYPMSHLFVTYAPGHNAVVIDAAQVYRKTRKAKKEHKAGLRIELNRTQTLQLIEALSASLRETPCGF